MAEVISAAGEAVGVNELHGELERVVPGSAQLLSGARLGESGVDSVALSEGLERRLKEFELERRIAVGKARLRSADSFASQTEYDEVFRELSQLQRRLDGLRRGGDGNDTDLEAQE